MAGRHINTPEVGVFQGISNRTVQTHRPTFEPRSPRLTVFTRPSIRVRQGQKGRGRRFQSVIGLFMSTCVIALTVGCAARTAPTATPNMLSRVQAPFDQLNQLRDGHPARTVMPSYLTISAQNLAVAETTRFQLRGGNALVLNADGLAVTNAHMARYLSSSLVAMTPQRSRLHTQIIGLSPHYDLAVLQVPPYADMRPLVPGNPDDLRPGDTLYAMGISHQAKTFAQARVIDPNCIAPHPMTKRNRALITVESAGITHGYSGGPLFTDDGKVVGMIVGVLNSDTCGKHTFAIRIDEIVRETERIWGDFYKRYSAL